MSESESITSFNQLYQEYCNPIGKLMVAAHRGIWFDAPENSILSIQHAIAVGVDMVEIDVQRTRDGVLILMHDETVDRMTNGTGRIDELEYSQIKSLNMKQSQGGDNQLITEIRIPTLEEVMLLVKNKIFVNLDKCWAFREDIYQVLIKTGTLNHALYKSNAKLEEVEVFLNSKQIRPEYMHIIDKTNSEILENLNEFLESINPRAVELIFSNEEGLFTAKETFETLHGRCRVWISTMWDSLCAGHTDEQSLVNVEYGWGWAIERGANMIQTDNPPKAVEYRNHINDLR